MFKKALVYFVTVVLIAAPFAYAKVVQKDDITFRGTVTNSGTAVNSGTVTDSATGTYSGTNTFSGATTLSGAVARSGFETTPGGEYVLHEVVAATNVLTAAECGKTMFLNHATEFVSTLPAISTVSAGCNFEFIITAAASGANYTVITGNSKETKIQGAIDDANVRTACANEDTITFVDGNAVGDWATVKFDGSNWIIDGASLTDAKITCTDEA